MIIEFDFLPPTVNSAYYTDFNNRTRHKSKAYRDFIKSVGVYLPKGQSPITADIEMEYIFYFPDLRKRDVMNYEKAMTDTLVYYGVIKDDSQIQKITLEKYYDKGKPYTIIEIKHAK